MDSANPRRGGLRGRDRIFGFTEHELKGHVSNTKHTISI